MTTSKLPPLRCWLPLTVTSFAIILILTKALMDNDVLGGLPIALNHNPVGVLPTATHSCPPEPAPTTGPDLPAADPLPKAWTSFFPSSPCPLSQQTIHPKLRSRQIEFREQQRAFPTNLSAFEINAENLARRADGDQTVVITFATDGWQEFVVHWQHRLERLGVSNFFIVALDMQIFQSLYYPGAPLLLPSHMVSGKDNTRTQWGKPSQRSKSWRGFWGRKYSQRR